MMVLLAALATATVFDRDERVVYLREVFAAVRTTPVAELEDTYGYIDVMDRNECGSVYHRLRAQCLVDTARRNCRGRRGKEARRACALYSDVIITNKLSEDHFVTTVERYTIMRHHQDFRSRLRKALRRRYGTLVTELGLSRGSRCGEGDLECLARDVNDYCIDVADTRSLSWQHCAAAVTWFIGTTRADGSR